MGGGGGGEGFLRHRIHYTDYDELEEILMDQLSMSKYFLTLQLHMYCLHNTHDAPIYEYLR